MLDLLVFAAENHKCCNVLLCVRALDTIFNNITFHQIMQFFQFFASSI